MIKVRRSEVYTRGEATSWEYVNSVHDDAERHRDSLDPAQRSNTARYARHRCSHIKKLNPPFFEELIYEANEANRLWPKSGRKDEAFPQGGWPHDTIPYGRFFSEYWVTNDALGVRPSHQVGYLEYGQHDKQTCLVDERTICTG